MDLRVRNMQGTKKEIILGINKNSFVETLKKNTAWQIDFDIYLMSDERNKVSYDLITWENTVLYNDQEFIIKQMSEKALGEQIFKRVTAIHVHFTMQDGVQHDVITGTFSIQQCLNHIFAPDNRGFSWRVNDPNGLLPRLEFENFGDDDYLRLRNQLIDRFNVVVIPDIKSFTVVPASEFGEKTESVIRYKYNTDDVRFTIDTFNLKTQITGFGGREELEDGTQGDYFFPPITYTSPNANTWGIRVAHPIRDERFRHAENMRERLIQILQDSPLINGETHLKLPFDVELGNHVRFIYEPLNVSQYIQIVGIKRWPMDESHPPEVEFSNNKKTMSKIMVQIAQRG